jgi:hypothetical protein
MARLLSNRIFDAAAACADRIRELGLTPGTQPYMRGQLGYQDYIDDVEDLCRVWDGSFDDPNPLYSLFEWGAGDDSRLDRADLTTHCLPLQR